MTRERAQEIVNSRENFGYSTKTLNSIDWNQVAESLQAWNEVTADTLPSENTEVITCFLASTDAIPSHTSTLRRYVALYGSAATMFWRYQN